MVEMSPVPISGGSSCRNPRFLEEGIEEPVHGGERQEVLLTRVKHIALSEATRIAIINSVRHASGTGVISFD